jgi:hypothetical protein
MHVLYVYSLANLEQHLAPGQAVSPYGILNKWQNTEVFYCTLSAI